MKFKNNDERKVFLSPENYRKTWDIVLNAPDFGVRIYRFEALGSSIYAEEYYRSRYRYDFKRLSADWQFRRFYVVENNDPFRDHDASLTQAIEWLKKMDKEGRL